MGASCQTEQFRPVRDNLRSSLGVLVKTHG